MKPSITFDRWIAKNAAVAAERVRAFDAARLSRIGIQDTDEPPVPFKRKGK